MYHNYKTTKQTKIEFAEDDQLARIHTLNKSINDNHDKIIKHIDVMSKMIDNSLDNIKRN